MTQMCRYVCVFPHFLDAPVQLIVFRLLSGPPSLIISNSTAVNDFFFFFFQSYFIKWSTLDIRKDAENMVGNNTNRIFDVASFLSCLSCC